MHIIFELKKCIFCTCCVSKGTFIQVPFFLRRSFREAGWDLRTDFGCFTHTEGNREKRERDMKETPASCNDVTQVLLQIW